MEDTRNLVNYINEINASTQNWINEDPDNRFAGMLTSVPEHWTEYGIYTPAELDRYLLEDDYMYLYKEVNGYRSGQNLTNVSTTKLKEIVGKLNNELETSNFKEYNF